jgi:hypothetical protein
LAGKAKIRDKGEKERGSKEKLGNWRKKEEKLGR